MGYEINKMSQVIEDAVLELVRIFLHQAQLGQNTMDAEVDIEISMVMGMLCTNKMIYYIFSSEIRRFIS